MSVSMVTRLYSGFKGVDFRGEVSNLVRSPDSLNVWKDYKEVDSIRTRPGMEKVLDIDNVKGIYFYKDEMIVHSGSYLYKVKDGKKEQLYMLWDGTKGDAFVFNNVFYFFGGFRYVQYDGTECKEVEGYVPTTSIARKPSGGGTIYQDVNMLSEYRINTFLADGESKTYMLDALDINGVSNVKVNGVEVDLKNYTVDYKKGSVTFTEAPPAPNTDGQDNVSIQYKKRTHDLGILNPLLPSEIALCTLLQVFDNRVFFSGNPSYPNTVWHCSLDDPTYISDLDYYREGVDDAHIRGLVAGNNALWVFREPSDANTTVFYHTPTLDTDYGKIYPSQHSSVTIGCVGRAINFNDDIVFFSERGMEGISGDVTTEQFVEHRSSLVDRKLTAESGYKNMLLEEWEGYLLVFIGNMVYLADSRTAFTIDDHIEYEWYVWDMGVEITAAKVHNGILYLGTKDGVYTLTDNECAVESYWTTPHDRFKNPHKLKSTNKRGCVVEATGDIDVYTKTEDTDFTLIGEFRDITDYFVCRIKEKKFKDIQVKFHSKTRFSLESVTLESFILGYIKR